jgi:hypothetical protein
MKIIISLTAHEEIECLYDLLDNIKKCFIHYDILVLLSLQENLYTLFNKTYDFVKIVTIRPCGFLMWGNINLFNQHMLNLKYTLENNISYDYFWFAASNEMFIKIIPPDFVENNTIKIVSKKEKIDDTEYETYFKNLLNNQYTEWMWLNRCNKDKNFTDYIYKNKCKVYGGIHEGLVLPCTIMLEIFEEYTNNQIYEKTTFDNYVMEEIFIPTYILNKYNVINYPDTFCVNYSFTLGNNVSYEEIKNKLLTTHVSIKPVIRNYNNEMRKHIRNIIN